MISHRVAFAEFLQVIGIVGSHHPVFHTGNLPGLALLVVLDSTHHADLVADGQDIQATAGQVMTIVDIDAIAPAGLVIIIFHIDALAAAVHGYDAIKSDFHIAVIFNVGPQFPQG